MMMGSFCGFSQPFRWDVNRDVPRCDRNRWGRGLGFGKDMALLFIVGWFSPPRIGIVNF